MTPLENLEARTHAWLGQLDLALGSTEGGIAALRTDKAVVLVSCFDDQGATFCRIAGLVLAHVHPSLPLLHRLLQLNTDVIMGAFQLFEDRQVVFSISLAGESLDADMFARALRYVAHVADTCADELHRLGRGVAATELLERRSPCGSP